MVILLRRLLPGLLVAPLLGSCTLLLATDDSQCEIDLDCPSDSVLPMYCEQRVCMFAEPELPLTVDRYFAPTARSGDAPEASLAVSDECPERAGLLRGECHRFAYTPPVEASPGSVGAVWRADESEDGVGIDVPQGAVAVSFYAWSDRDISVTFAAGSFELDAFEARTGAMHVGAEPTAYHIDLRGTSYDEVVSAFSWSAEGSQLADDVVLYVDDIVWVDALPSPQLVANQRVYSASDTILLTYAFGPGNPTDWIGMYLWSETPGDGSTTSEDYAYVSGARSGSLTLEPEGATYVVPELYKVGFWANDAWDEVLVEPFYFLIGPAPTLAVGVSGSTATVSYAGGPALLQDWVGVFPVGSDVSPEDALVYEFASGTSGELSFEDLPLGEYFATYVVHFQTGFEPSRRAYFAIE
jgi:hypothetical protein